MSETLSAGELLDLTGTLNKKKQREIIKGFGINPLVRPDGSIALTRTVLEWSKVKLAKSSAELSPLETLEKSLPTYIFTRAHILNNAHSYRYDINFCGVYFLVCRGELRYVGISNHIARRIRQHLKEGTKEFDSLFAFEAPERFLERIEELYIWWLDPPDNIIRRPPAHELTSKYLSIIGKRSH